MTPADHRALCDSRCPLWRSERRRERWDRISMWIPWLSLAILAAWLLRARLAVLVHRAETAMTQAAANWQISTRQLADFAGDVEKYLRSEGY